MAFTVTLSGLKEGEYLPAHNAGSTYCAKHRRYYKADAVCPICIYEESPPGRKIEGITRIQKRPVCGEMSLFWYQCSNRHECLNIDCKLRYAEAAEY